MAKQENIVRKPQEQSGEKKAVTANQKVIEKGRQIKENIDDLLDEIDNVLEKNAEEFVKAYVQKGGQ